MYRKSIPAILCLGFVAVSVFAQEAPETRAFGILPTNKAADASAPFHPLSAKQKFTIARKDAFDTPVYFLAGFYAGLDQLQNINPSFGQGMEGYAKRYGTNLADQVIGGFMTEGIFPSLLHEDPRYFRLGAGTGRHRLGYALSRVLVTRTDSNRRRFNYSEVVGNCATVGISNAYNPGSRNYGDNLQKLGIRLGTDAITNVVTEFWPDMRRKLFHKRGP